jgi:hypothetical protein
MPLAPSRHHGRRALLSWSAQAIGMMAAISAMASLVGFMVFSVGVGGLPLH